MVVRRRRQEAIVYGDGTRHCNQCGAHIDPIDWCGDCQAKQAPCGVHRRLRMRSDAAFCDRECRSAYHQQDAKDRREARNTA